MQFKLEFVVNAEEDRLLEAVNEYLYHSYKDLSEVPEDEIIDAPYTDIINMLRAYLEEYEIQLLILTGRNDTPEIRQATLEWLGRNWFHPDKLFMRKPKDYSKTMVYKEKTYTEQIEPYYDVIMVFEDNNACVQMFRDKGLIVLQPQNSDY